MQPTLSTIVHTVTKISEDHVICCTMNKKELDTNEYVYYTTNSEGEEIWFNKSGLSNKDDFSNPKSEPEIQIETLSC